MLVENAKEVGLHAFCHSAEPRFDKPFEKYFEVSTYAS